MNDYDVALPVINRIEALLAGFAAGLDETWASEFEGVKSVVTEYVLQDLRERSVDHSLMGLVVGAISQEVDRLVQIGFPFTQEFCAQIAQGFEDLGEVYDDLRLRQPDSSAHESALISYELAVVWYRVVKTAYTGFLPVQSQLRIVQSLIRLGTLVGSRETFRRAIRELFFLIDEDKFVSLMTQERRVRLTESEKEGLLAHRQRMRSSIRQTMVEAITRLHQSIPARVRADYVVLERQIVASEKGPADLMRFLQNVTVIPELKRVEGGRDWLVTRGSKRRYLSMRDHVQEMVRALDALEARAYGYFRSRLVKEDRAKTDAHSFRELFRDVFEDYHAFTRRSGISKVNFWISLLLHDVGRILLDSHHRGGAILARSLLETLGIQGFRRQSITDYIRYHGQWKRLYFLENSPKEVLDYIDRVGPESIPFMLLEKRRIESIADLAATGGGRLTIDFIRESSKYRDPAYLKDLARTFGARRLSAWELRGAEDLYETQILPGERVAFFDSYLNETRIVHSHNLPKVLSPPDLLKFHYICARICGIDGFSIREVRLNSDKVEDLQALKEALQRVSLADLRRRFAEIRFPARLSSPSAKAGLLTAELVKNPGLLIEFKNQNETLSVNTTYSHRALDPSG